MVAAALVLALSLPVFTLYWEAARLTPLVVTSLFLTPILMGYAELDAINDSATGIVYCAAAYCFVFGYLLHQAWIKFRRASPLPARKERFALKSSREIILFCAVVVLLALYHFLVSGVPVLSADVETTRFDFTSSGLFGVPGRMFLFGLPFAALAVSVSAVRPTVRVSRLLAYCVWGSYATASLLGGFKGGLMTVLTATLLARSVVGQPLSVRRVLVGWRVLLLVAALVFGGLIAFRYKSLGLTSPSDVVPYLAARATVEAAQPGYLVLTRYGSDGSGGQEFGQDALYFLKKYIPLLPIDDGTAFPFEKKISATLSHTPISNKAFIVPVTIGAFPELVANIGVAYAFVAMFFFGAALSLVVSISQTFRSSFGSALFALSAHFLLVYILNGDLVYACLNLLLMSMLLWALYVLCRLLSKIRRESDAPRCVRTSLDRTGTRPSWAHTGVR